MPRPGQPPQRQPPPSLFLGPPSRDASHISLSSILNSDAPSTANAQRRQIISDHSRRNADPARLNKPDVAADQTAAVVGSAPSISPADIPLSKTISREQRQRNAEDQKQTDRTDALWAEMQDTLEEVELSAANGPHVFGTEHSRSLEELRSAQIALAKAWARSEAEEAYETAAEQEERKSKVSQSANFMNFEEFARAENPAEAAANFDSASKSAAEGGGTTGRKKGDLSNMLEEETERDILLARKRREANDRYFQRVNNGVLDVMAKLEDVASAMRGVERESRSIWSESDESLEDSSS